MPRSATETTARIRDAAARRFAETGFERTTVRAVAADAGVDPALVMRYFGNKESLFATVADLRLDLPDLTGLDHEQVADALVHRFFEVWEEQDTFLVLLRASTSSAAAAERLLSVFAEQAAPALAHAAYDDPARRAALVGSQVIGFAFARYVLRVAPLVAMSREDVRRWLGPTIIGYLTEDR